MIRRVRGVYTQVYTPLRESVSAGRGGGGREGG